MSKSPLSQFRRLSSKSSSHTTPHGSIVPMRPSGFDMCSMDSLPDDVILEIFSVLLTNVEEPLQKRLAAVCRRWRELVVQNPLLWTQVQVSKIKPCELLHHFEMSKPALIDIYHGREQTKHHPGDYLEHLWNAVTQRHASRVRSLTIHTHEALEVVRVFKKWTDFETPNLQSISLFSSEGTIWWGREMLGIFTPWPSINSLLTLKLHGFEIQYFPAAPNLIFLELYEIDDGPQFLQTLVDNYPSLKTLVIHKLPLTNANLSFEDHQRQSVIAPSLRSLAVRHHPELDYVQNHGFIVPYLSAPNLQYLEVAGQYRTLLKSQETWSPTIGAPDLQMLRINSRWITMRDVSLFSLLPNAVDLELAQLPQDGEEILLALFKLTNLHSLTLDLPLPSPNYYDRHKMGPAMFSSIILRRRPKLGCPTFLRSVEGMTPQVKSILGPRLTDLAPRRLGFLDVPPPLLEWELNMKMLKEGRFMGLLV